MTTTPVDPRGADEFEVTLHSRVPGYLPGWELTTDGAASAVLAIAARMSAVVADRLNRAPTKNQLAFLDMLGLSLLPAQAARAPVAFTLRPGIGDSRAPAGTQVGATVAGVDRPLIFETERDIGLAGAKLVEVATVLPGSDQWASHTADYEADKSFTLFGGLQPVGHELYIAHDVHFALQGHCEVRVQLELVATGQRRIPTLWEYWDGETWRPFTPFNPPAETTASGSVDGTNGLTRSGTIVLRAEGASAKRRVVNWVDSYWIRARCAKPITPDYAAHLPTIERILIGSVIAPPIGAVTFMSFHGTPLPPDKWPTMKMPVVVAFAPLAMSTEPSSAAATITELEPEDEDAHTQSTSLASGFGVLGPVPVDKQGKYKLEVTIAGFAASSVEIQMGDSAPDDYFLLWADADLTDRPPDKGASAGLALDLSKAFYPFGPSPQPGAACYLMAADALSKPGATVTMVFDPAETGLDDTSTGVTRLVQEVDPQYFNGEQWQHLDVETLPPGGMGDPPELGAVFSDGGSVRFKTPPDCAPTMVNDTQGYWVRFRITSGTYGLTRAITVSSSLTYKTREVISPAVKAVRYTYYYRSPLEAPSACHTCNDFTWGDHSADVVTRGSRITPFTVVSDPTPAVYFGFDAALPQDVLSIYLDVDEVAGEESGPDLLWECLDDNAWRAMSVEDETGAITLPGTTRVAFPGVAKLPRRLGVQIESSSVRTTDLTADGQLRQGDVVSVGDDTGSELAVIASVDDRLLAFKEPTAKLYPRATVTKTGKARFGTPRPAWIRARLRRDGQPPERVLNGVHLNTAWATNVQTRRDEVLGTSDGNPGQSVSFSYTPVLPGERIEVLELAGPRAQVDYDDLRDDVISHGGTEDDLRQVEDGRTGRIAQVWVRWTAQPNLYFSGPADRHYTIERTRGLVRFGDGRHGRVPPTGTDGIHATLYRSGGGRIGNVDAGAITQLLSGVPASSIINIRAAEGGADGESPTAALERGPASIAARSQALTVADYEVLAREASPAVAFARALPATDPTGRPRPGFVRLIVIPDAADPRPEPNFGLRRLVQNYVRRRIPASMSGQVHVVAPDYQPVGVLAEIVPVDMDSAGPTIESALTAVRQFMHPVTGGPDGTGWAFGRDVYLSDLARVIGGVSGVDYVRTLELLVDGTPRGQVVRIAQDKIVVAGDVTVRLAGGE